MPPGRRSSLVESISKPFGPHQRASRLTSVQARHTVSRGASNVRTISSSAPCGAVVFGAMIPSCCVEVVWSAGALAPRLARRLRLLGLELAQVVVEPVEALVEEAAVVLEPAVDALQSLGIEAAGTPLRLAAAGDEAGALQHLQMLRDGGQAHAERLRELRDGRLAEAEPRQDGAPGRDGQRREGRAEAVARHTELPD